MATYLCVKANNTTKKYEVKSSANKPYMRVNTGYIPLTTQTNAKTALKIKNKNNTYEPIETYTTTRTITESYSVEASTGGYFDIYTGTASTSANTQSITGFTITKSEKVNIGSCTGVVSDDYSTISRSSYTYLSYLSLESIIYTQTWGHLRTDMNDGSITSFNGINYIHMIYRPPRMLIDDVYIYLQFSDNKYASYDLTRTDIISTSSRQITETITSE